MVGDSSQEMPDNPDSSTAESAEATRPAETVQAGKPLAGTEAVAPPSSPPVWQEIRADVQNGFDTDIKQSLAELDLTEDQAERAAEHIWQAEQAFVQRVSDVVDEVMSTTDQQVILLFDVDNTLGRMVWNWDADGDTPDKQTQLRPSAIPLLMHLRRQYGARLEMGLLTTRQVGKEMQDKEHLGQIAGYVKPELLFSTEMLKSPDQLPNLAARKQLIDDGVDDDVLLETCHEIVDKPTPEAETDGSIFPLDEWDRRKLVLLSSVVEKYPDRVVIVVDDARYPALVKKSGPHVRSVPLQGEPSGVFILDERLGMEELPTKE